MKTFLLFTLSILWLVFSAFGADATPKTITASSSNGSLLWPTNFFSANSNSIWTVLGGGETGVLAIERGGTGTTNAAGLRGVIGLDAGDPGSMGTNWLTLTTAAEGRGVLGLDVAMPGALGTNLLTQATAAGVRGLVGLDAGAPGALGTNWLTLGTSADGRYVLGLYDWVTNSSKPLDVNSKPGMGINGAHSSAVLFDVDVVGGDAGVRFLYGANDYSLKMFGRDLQLVETSDGSTPHYTNAPIASAILNFMSLTNLFVRKTNEVALFPIADTPSWADARIKAAIYGKASPRGEITLHGLTTNEVTGEVFEGEVPLVDTTGKLNITNVVLGTTNVVEAIAGKQPADAQLDEWASVSTNSVTALGVGVLTATSVDVGATNVVAAISGKQDADAQLDEWATVSTNSVTALGVGALTATTVIAPNLTAVVADIAAMTNYTDATTTTIVVKDVNSGGTFAYAASGYTADDGNIFPATGIGSGYWVRQNPLKLTNVRSYGAVGDGTTDDTAAITAAAAAADLLRIHGVLYFPPGEYAVSDTISVRYANITMHGATLLATWSASTHKVCLSIGVSSANSSSYRRYEQIRVARKVESDWIDPSLEDIGIRMYCPWKSHTRIDCAIGFTVGVQVAVGTGGAYYNRFWLGSITGNMYGFHIAGSSSSQGFNANRVYNGEFSVVNYLNSSFARPGISRYAIVFDNSSTYRHHDNVFTGQIVELNASDASPGEAAVMMMNVGNQNEMRDLYVENMDYLLVTTGSTAENRVQYIEANTMPGSEPYHRNTSTGQNFVQQSSRLDALLNKYLVYDSGWIAKQIGVTDTRTNLPPPLFRLNSTSITNSAPQSYLRSGAVVKHDSVGEGYVDMASHLDAMCLRLDCRVSKRFLVDWQLAPNTYARHFVRLIDSNGGVIQDNDNKPVSQKQNSVAYSVSDFQTAYGGCYYMLSMSNFAQYYGLTVPDAASYCDVMITRGQTDPTSPKVRRLRVYAEQPAASVVNVTGNAGDVTVNKMPPTEGSFPVGQHFVINDTASIGSPRGWICTTAGTFGGTITETASIVNASPLITMSANTHTINVGEHISGTGFGGRVIRISSDRLTLLLSSNSTATASGRSVAYTTPVFSPYGNIDDVYTVRTAPTVGADQAALWAEDSPTGAGTARLYTETENGKSGPVDIGWRSPITAQRTSLDDSTAIVDASGALGDFDSGWTAGGVAGWTTADAGSGDYYANVDLTTAGVATLTSSAVANLTSAPRVVTVTITPKGSWTISNSGKLELLVGGNVVKTWSSGYAPSGPETINGCVDGTIGTIVFRATVTTGDAVQGSFDSIGVTTWATADLLHRHIYAAASLVPSATAAPYFEFSSAGYYPTANAKSNVVALASQLVNATPDIVAHFGSATNGLWRMSGKVFAPGTVTNITEITYTDAAGTQLQILTNKMASFGWANSGYLYIGGADADVADADVAVTTSSVEFKP